MTITNDYNQFLKGCIKNGAVDYKILYENKEKECQELEVKADAETTADMMEKLNEEYEKLYNECEELKKKTKSMENEIKSNSSIVAKATKDKMSFETLIQYVFRNIEEVEEDGNLDDLVRNIHYECSMNSGLNYLDAWKVFELMDVKFVIDPYSQFEDEWDDNKDDMIDWLNEIYPDRPRDDDENFDNYDDWSSQFEEFYMSVVLQTEEFVYDNDNNIYYY